MEKTIAVACDAAGLALKKEMMQHLEELGYTCLDFGAHSEESSDYPDFAKPACEAVVQGKCQYGLLFCGTGVGMSIAANKVHGIRACCCSDTFSAEQTRRHNNANVLCIGARVVGAGLATVLIDTFLQAPFEGGRHQRRVDKITQIENER